MSETPPLLALDGALGPLRNRVDRAGTEPLFADGNDQPLGPGLMLRLDPQARATGHWSSPEGRLLELHLRISAPGAWFGLHLALPEDLPPLTKVRWIGLAARSGATRAAAIRVCLRSGLAEGGFRDTFFPLHLLSQGRLGDHHDLLAPAQHPDLPATAPWRELVLFLPPAEDLDWALHDLRVFAL